MKKIIKACWITGSIILVIVFIIASFSAFIQPAHFIFIAIFALGFPFIFIAMFITAIVNFFVHKKLAIIMSCLLVLGIYNLHNTYAITPGAKWNNPKSDTTLRIMTWNCYEFINSFPQSSPLAGARVAMLDSITAYNPDILCLQEFSNMTYNTHQVSIKHELDSLGYHYMVFPIDRIDPFSNKGALKEKGVIICSKIPFVDSGNVLIKDNWTNEKMAFGDVVFNGKRLRIVTAHLYSYDLFPEGHKGYDDQNIFKKLYKYKLDVVKHLLSIDKQHQKQADIITSFVNKSPYPVIYCGDLNSTPTSYVFHQIKDKKQDAFLEKGNGIGMTFYKMIPTLRIDVCFADTAFAVDQCAVMEKKLSDHYPVITDVHWKQ